MTHKQTGVRAEESASKLAFWPVHLKHSSGHTENTIPDATRFRNLSGRHLSSPTPKSISPRVQSDGRHLEKKKEANVVSAGGYPSRRSTSVH